MSSSLELKNKGSPLSPASTKEGCKGILPNKLIALSLTKDSILFSPNK